MNLDTYRYRATAQKSARRAATAGGCPSEHEEQKALMIWATAQVGRGRWMLVNLFAIPNGGDRHPAVAGKLKAEGVMCGVPDLLLAWPAGGYHGLFIELKRRRGGRVSPDQEKWHGRLRQAGYAVVVARGCTEAAELITAYLDGKEKEDGL